MGYDPPATTGRSRGWKRTLFILLGILVFTFVGFGLAYWYFRTQAEARLAEAMARTDRLDPGWTLEELEAKRKTPSPEKNSAEVVLRVVSLLSGAVGNGPDESRWSDYPIEREWPAEYVKDLRASLKSQSDALKEARMIADLPEGRYKVNWTEDAISTLLPHVQQTREVARLLNYDAQLRAHDKDMDGALASCRAVLNTGRSLGEEGTLISVLVRIAIQAVSIHRLERVLVQGEASSQAVALMQRLLEDEAKTPVMVYGFRGERAMVDRTLRSLQG